MRNLHVYGLAAVLAAIGLGLFAYKVVVLGLPLRAAAAVTAWQVDTEIHVTAGGGPLKISLFVPEDSRDYSVLDQRLAAPDFGTGGMEAEDWSSFGSVVKTMTEFKTAYDAFKARTLEFVRKVAEGV